MAADDSNIKKYSRRRFFRGLGLGTGLALLASRGVTSAASSEDHDDKKTSQKAKDWPWSKSLALEPTAIPGPIKRDHSQHHDIELVASEVEGKLDDGTTFRFMTWNDKVPGPMLRVRQDDTITLKVVGASHNKEPHNVDFHAVYGTGGGAEDTLVGPGQSRRIRFKCCYPGAFVYHCAVANMDEHISRGMFGLIVVEPHDGLPEVDREFYLGQHEIYTHEPHGSPGLLGYSYDATLREQPEYVVFNGAVHGFTPDRLGPMTAKVGETVRVFMASGGPNLLSSFHPIGNVWTRCWPQGALADEPAHHIQTQPVPPGSGFVGDMELPVPGTINLVDHALSRAQSKGAMAQIKVEGKANTDVYKVLD